MAKRNRAQRQRLKLFVADGSMEEDGSARKVGAQIISDVANGVALPGRQLPSPVYVHRELNRAPTQQDGEHVETVNPIPAEMDSQFVNFDAQAMWDGARLDLDSEKDENRRHTQWLQWLFFAGGMMFLVFAMFMFSHASDARAEEEEQRQQQQQAPAPTPTPARPIIPRVGGN